MSILDRVPLGEMGTKFTHKGWMFGLCPVYVGHPFSDSPRVATRNWVPEIWFDISAALFDLFCTVAEMVNPEFEASFPILITGKLGPEEPAQ